MAITVIKGQIVRAGAGGISVYDTYSTPRKVLFSANKGGEELGESTGLTFPGKTSSVDITINGTTTTDPGHAIDWIQLEYLAQTTNFFGIPTFVRKVGYASSEEVVLEEPQDTDPWGIGSGTDPVSGGSGTETNPDTTTAPDTTKPTKDTTVPGAEVDTTKKNDPKGTLTVARKETASGLPKWAKWALIGLGAVMLILAGVLLAKPKKKKGAPK